MTKPPSRIWLSYAVFDVSSYEKKEEDTHLGLFNGPSQQIQYRQGQHPAEEANTILHEVMHALFVIYGANSFFKNKKEEEFAVGLVTNGLCDLIKRNPNFMAYLQAKLNTQQITVKKK